MKTKMVKLTKATLPKTLYDIRKLGIARRLCYHLETGMKYTCISVELPDIY